MKTKKKNSNREYVVVEPKKLHPVGETLGQAKKGICNKIFHKIQFVKFEPGMRIFSHETTSEHKMLNCYGFGLMMVMILVFFAFFLES